MSDKLRNTLQNIPEFALGEQPDPTKLNQSFRVIQQALNQLEESVGDITVKTSANTNLSDRPLTIGNLGRFVGPSQSISPPISSREKFTYSSVLATGTNIWTVPVWAYDGTATNLTINTNNATDFQGSSLFQTLVPFTQQLTSAGQYKFDPNRSQIVSFTPMAGGQATAVGTSFLNADLEYGGIGLYWNAGNSTPNVQPPFEVITPTSISVLASTNTLYSHIIEMGQETFTFTSPIHDTNGTHLNQGELTALGDLAETLELGINPIYSVTSQVQQRLPYELDSQLSVDDEIPRPFVLLYNETNDNLYETARYYYRDSTSFFFRGPSLNVLDNYRVITNGGADLSSVIEGLQFSMRHHKHKGPQAISHLDLARVGYSVKPSLLTSFISTDTIYGWHRPTQPSTMEGNQHPQYLMRNGYMHGMDNGNLNNMMLGELAMGIKISNVAHATNADVWDTNGESWPILFGGRGQVRLGSVANDTLTPGQALFFSGQAGTNISNHVKNLAILTNEDYDLSYFDVFSTDTIFEVSAADWQFGRDNIFLGSSPNVERTKMSLKGTALRSGAAATNSEINISGMTNEVDGNFINSNINLTGSNVDALLSSGSNVDLNVSGHSVAASVYNATNSQINIHGSNLNITCTDLNSVSMEIISDGPFALEPANNFGSGVTAFGTSTKYIRAKNFYIDADDRIVRKKIMKSNVMYIDDPPGGAGARTMERGLLTWDDSHLGTGDNAWQVQKPSAFSTDCYMIYDFDLPDDAALTRIRLVSFQEVSPGVTTYEVIGFNENGQVTGTRASTSIVGPAAVTDETIVDWVIGSNLFTHGDRFPSATDHQLTLKASKAAGIVSGWYEYKLMRQ